MSKRLLYAFTQIMLVSLIALPRCVFSEDIMSAPPTTNPPASADPMTAAILPDVPASSPLLSSTNTTTTVTRINTQPGAVAAAGTLPPAGPSRADEAQFQDWLKENREKMAARGNNLPSEGGVQALPPKPRKVIRVPHGPNAPAVTSVPLTLEESQQIMLDSTPPSPPPSEESTMAFNAMMKQNVPLTPQQVVRLRQIIDSSQRAAAIPATVPPKPVSSTIIANMAPGATPPAIRIAQGYISSLVFVDSAGSPWPVGAYDIGDPKATSIQWDGKSNILLIQAATPYSDSNLVVRLAGLPTPITLELVSGQRVVDFRTDVHVPGIGPNTKDLPTGVELPNSANQLLLSVLDGVAPSGSKILTVAGGDCQAWLLGDKMYLRTRLTVLSPGWVGKMSSPDGMYAYEIQRTSSVLVSLYGEPVELKVGGF